LALSLSLFFIEINLHFLIAQFARFVVLAHSAVNFLSDYIFLSVIPLQFIRLSCFIATFVGHVKENLQKESLTIENSRLWSEQAHFANYNPDKVPASSLKERPTHQHTREKLQFQASERGKIIEQHKNSLPHPARHATQHVSHVTPANESKNIRLALAYYPTTLCNNISAARDAFVCVAVHLSLSIAHTFARSLAFFHGQIACTL
jgi:hypothetical protein